MDDEFPLKDFKVDMFKSCGSSVEAELETGMSVRSHCIPPGAMITCMRAEDRMERRQMGPAKYSLSVGNSKTTLRFQFD